MGKGDGVDGVEMSLRVSTVASGDGASCAQVEEKKYAWVSHQCK